MYITTRTHTYGEKKCHTHMSRVFLQPHQMKPYGSGIYYAFYAECILKRFLCLYSPNQWCLEIKKAINFAINVIGRRIRCILLLLLQLLLLLLQCQLLLLLCIQHLLELQTSTTRLILITWLHKFQLRALVTPPEICHCQQNQDKHDYTQC